MPALTHDTEHLLYDEAHANKPLKITNTPDLIKPVCHGLAFMTVRETSFTQNKTKTKAMAFENFLCSNQHREHFIRQTCTN